MQSLRESYPLENKVKELFNRDLSGLPFEPTGLGKEYYLDLAEPIVRRTAEWEDERGAINDPFEHRERVHISSYFVGALSTLILAGRCKDLIEKCKTAMDACCHDLYQKKIADQHLDFCTTILVKSLRCLKEFSSDREQERWRRWLGGFDPEKTYRDVEGPDKPASAVHNWNLYAVAGEWLKKAEGLADNMHFIEKYLSHQITYFTPYGLYKDPNDPILYDILSRVNAASMLYNGYDGPCKGVLAEMIRRGNLTMLFMQSPSGEIPYGGRSNQGNANEGAFAVLCEFEASRYKALGNLNIAGAFKRAAHLAVLSLTRWSTEATGYFAMKNLFSPELRHGYDSYAYYSHFMFGIAHFLSDLYLYADDGVEERPAPCDVGGYVIELPNDFHKVFATVNGMHLEIDSRGDFSHDPTGLGRIHKKGIPTELGLSMGIVKSPHYSVSVPPSEVNLAIGPAWEDRWGQWHRLSEYSQQIMETHLEVKEETISKLHFRLEYNGAFHGCESILEEYVIRDDKVEIQNVVRGQTQAIRAYFPLLVTNGSDRTSIDCRKDGFDVMLGEFTYSVRAKTPEAVIVRILDVEAPNRNGIYKIGFFEKQGHAISYEIQLR